MNRRSRSPLDASVTARPSRRDIFRWSGLAALSGAGLGAACAAPSDQQAPPPPVGPDFTAAFLTDTHVNELKGAPDGTRKAVEHAHSLERPPELILTGGDLVFDILATDKAKADAQYDLYDEAFSASKVTVHPAMGNHDMLGVYEESGVSDTDPLYGKKYFTDRFSLDQPYYSFDHEGWHFVVLDTLGIDGTSYKGWVDAEQIAWLEDDLSASNRPTVVVGHIPLLSNFMEMRRGTSEAIPGGISVVNAHEVIPVLEKHPVKLVLAGHLHVNEVFRYKGIEYANVGAVSGNWWNGLRDGFQEGYGLLEFRGDDVSWRYVDYGWEPPPETESGDDEAA